MKSLVLLLTSLFFALGAQAAGPLNVALEAYKVVDSNGQQSLADATNARPGDVLEYRAVYRNDSAKALRNIIATLPIPAAGVDYLPDAAAMRNAQASVDGKTYAALPLKRTVTLASGKRVEQLVPTTEYRFLRWTLGDLPAGASKSVSARVRIADLGTSTTAAR